MASSSEDNRRRKPRFQLNLPLQLNGKTTHDVEMIDISSTGMQLRSGEFDIFKGRGYQKDRVEQLKINIIARLAWAEPDENGGFLTGWKFEVEPGDVDSDGQNQAPGEQQNG